MTKLIERCVALFEDTMRCHYEIRVPAPDCLAEMASTIIPVIQAEERARIVAWLHNHDFEDDTFNDVSVVLAHAIKRLDHMPDTIEAQETQS